MNEAHQVDSEFSQVSVDTHKIGYKCVQVVELISVNYDQNEHRKPDNHNPKYVHHFFPQIPRNLCKVFKSNTINVKMIFEKYLKYN